MALVITVKSANNTQQKKDFPKDLFSTFNIKVNDVFAKEKSFTTICSSADDADNLCSVEVIINVLLQAGMTPIPSPELKARRSVIAKRVSTEIVDSTEAIIKEFYRANDWAGNRIETISKFQNLPFLKITFDSIDIRNKCKK